MADEEDVLAELAARLGAFVTAGMGPHSAWALRSALDAAQTAGVSGILKIRIPKQCKDRCDFGFTADKEPWSK